MSRYRRYNNGSPVMASGGSGIGIGAVLAIILSWMKWHSVGWAIIHGMLGWLYVFYYFFMGGNR